MTHMPASGANDPPVSQFPRPLARKERDALDFLLSVGQEGIEALRAQAEHVSVVGRCNCGCASIDFEVDRSSAPISPLPVRRPAIDAESKDREGSAGIYDLMLWADDGWLGGIELVTYGEEPVPTEFPDIARFGPPRFTPSGTGQRLQPPATDNFGQGSGCAADVNDMAAV